MKTTPQDPKKLHKQKKLVRTYFPEEVEDQKTLLQFNKTKMIKLLKKVPDDQLDNLLETLGLPKPKIETADQKRLLISDNASIPDETDPKQKLEIQQQKMSQLEKFLKDNKENLDRINKENKDKQKADEKKLEDDLFNQQKHLDDAVKEMELEDKRNKEKEINIETDEKPKKEIDVDTKEEKKEEKKDEDDINIGIQGGDDLKKRGPDSKMVQEAQKFFEDPKNAGKHLTLTLYGSNFGTEDKPIDLFDHLHQGQGFDLASWVYKNWIRPEKTRLTTNFGNLPEAQQWKLHLKGKTLDGIGVMTLDPNEKLDKTKIDEIAALSKKLGNRPIVIKQEGKISHIYGYTDKKKDFEITPLDKEASKAFNNLHSLKKSDLILNVDPKWVEAIGDKHIPTLAEALGKKRKEIKLDNKNDYNIQTKLNANQNKNNNYNIQVNIPKPPDRNNLISKIAANDPQFKTLVDNINQSAIVFGVTKENPTVKDIQDETTKKMTELNNKVNDFSRYMDQDKQRVQEIMDTKIPAIDNQIKALDDKIKEYERDKKAYDDYFSDKKNDPNNAPLPVSDISKIQEEKKELEKEKTKLTEEKGILVGDIKTEEGAVNTATTDQETLKEASKALIKQVIERDEQLKQTEENQNKQGFKPN